jgi:hypothetical protein
VLRALYTRDADTLDKFLVAANHQRLEETKLAHTPSRDKLKQVAAQAIRIFERLGRDYQAAMYGGGDHDDRVRALISALVR